MSADDDGWPACDLCGRYDVELEVTGLHDPEMNLPDGTGFTLLCYACIDRVERKRRGDSNPQPTDPVA